MNNIEQLDAEEYNPPTQPQQRLHEQIEQERQRVTWEAVPRAESNGGTVTEQGGTVTGTSNESEQGGPIWPGFLPPDAVRYLAVLSVVPVERLARSRSGTTKAQLARWRRWEWFRNEEESAAKEAADLLLADAWSAATEGRLQPVYQMGMLVGYKREYSEKLHELLIRGLMKERFGAAGAATTTNNTVVLASPEAVADAVRRLSPTSSAMHTHTHSLPEV